VATGDTVTSAVMYLGTVQGIEALRESCAIAANEWHAGKFSDQLWSLKTSND
jgi:hypothetical protein